MTTEWQLQEAKNRLSQLIKGVVHGDPQVITVRGKPTAVLLSVEDYQRLTKPRTKLTDFFKESPLCGEELNLERNQNDFGREVEM